MHIKKQDEQEQYSSFAAYYKHEHDGQYPYLLATSLQRNNQQFQQTRAMKMLGDWVLEYQNMSQIVKYKYAAYIGKIQKILLNKFQMQAPIQYCLSRFITVFYSSWKELTSALVEQLKNSQNYALDLIWYTAHNLIEDMKIEKQIHFLYYLTSQFQEPLRFYRPQTGADARRILQIVYLLNVYNCFQNFSKNANNWAIKMQGLEQAASGDTSNQLLIVVLKNKSLLLMGQNSSKYWKDRVGYFIKMLQIRIPTMTSDNGLDRRLIDTLIWLMDVKQVRSILLQDQSRYLRTILAGMRPNNQNIRHIFHEQKYRDLRQKLYQLFFRSNKQETQNRLRKLLEQFTGHSFSIFNEENNYYFLQCISDEPVFIQTVLLTDTLKILNNNHIRRTLTAKVLLVLAKTITASLDSCIFTDEMLGMCLKAFNDCMVYKITDPLIGQLRQVISRLFLQLCKRYTWEDQMKSQIIFSLCEEYQKNSNCTSQIVLKLLCQLVKKFGFAQNNLHKLEPLIAEIHLKVVFDQQNMHDFISLMISVYFSTRWEKAVTYIHSVCSKNPSKMAPFFAFQAQTLIKSNDSSSQEELAAVAQILQSKQKWIQSRIQVNLMQLQMFFIKLSPNQGYKALRSVDEQILKLFQGFYQQGNYKLLSLLASKTIPSAGGAVNLQKLQSYKWLRLFSFEMLARSFYKSTSIYICCIFSNILLRAQNLAATLKWLCQQQFLQYLYQGLNDFLSKEKKYPIQVAASLLFFKLLQTEMQILPPESKIKDFSTLFKNVGWWDQAENKLHFSAHDDSEQVMAWLLPQFQNFYQQQMKNYYNNYLRSYNNRKMKQEKALRELAQSQEEY